LAGGILITGSTGQVGGELVSVLAPLGKVLGEIHAPPRAELDLTDPASIREIVRSLRPRWIVNPAAHTAVDKAESERDLAFAINAEAPRILGEEARKIGAAVLHFSTDYVFAGSGTEPYVESDPTGPEGVYGASKLAGEEALAASGAAHLIFRTSWVYGTTGKNFLLTVLRVARERPQMKIVADQYGAPTWARDLARMASHVMTHCETESHLKHAPLTSVVEGVQGVYHAAGAGETTWFGFAEEALRLRRIVEPDVSFAELIPIPSSDYPTPAKRPPNSRLDCSKLYETFGWKMLDWKFALEQVMSEL
jgi:dTDP-4-dehydrorhamnose reductase